MITERDLLEEIEECQRQPITDKKFERLASCFVVYDHLFGAPINSCYSYANEVGKPIITTTSDTEFLTAVNGKDTERVLMVLDELMETIKVLHPRMYDAVLQKIKD